MTCLGPAVDRSQQAAHAKCILRLRHVFLSSVGTHREAHVCTPPQPWAPACSDPKLSRLLSATEPGNRPLTVRRRPATGRSGFQRGGQPSPGALYHNGWHPHRFFPSSYPHSRPSLSGPLRQSRRYSAPGHNKPLSAAPHVLFRCSSRRQFPLIIWITTGSSVDRSADCHLYSSYWVLVNPLFSIGTH